MSHKNGTGTVPEVRRISVDSSWRSHRSSKTPGQYYKKLTRWLGKQWKLVIALIVVVLIIFLAYGYFTTKQQLSQAAQPAQAVKDAKTELIARVGQLVELPQGETPSMATVSDASKLHNQAFFAHAQNGDKVLVYAKAGRAILYRPSTNKVIEYSPVDLSGPTRQ